MKVVFALGIFTVLTTLTAAMPTGDFDFGPIDGGLVSTLRIVNRLCKGGKDEPGVPRAFYGCYEDDNGKSVFDECQIETFGGVLNNLPRINKACREIWNLYPYSKCLGREFPGSGYDMEQAVLQVNICQAEVLGIE